jgi:hypothetical protein
MTLTDLRKELKDLRKKAMPVPVSRMKKDDLLSELDRLRVKKEAAAAAEAAKPVPVPKAPKSVKVEDRGMEEPPKKKQKTVSAGPRVRAVKEAAEAKAKEAAKPAKAMEAAKSAKGSEEMKARMAKLREMRKAKKEEA